MTAENRTRELRKQVNEIIQYTAGIHDLDLTTLNWKDSPSQWSILECLEHLNRYNRYYNYELSNIVNTASSGNATNRSSWLGRKFIAMMHPSNLKKQKTMKHLNPVHSVLNEDTILEFISHQHVLLTIIDNCGIKSIDKQSIGVELFKLLRMPFFDALEFVIVHQQRHVLQIKGIMQKRSNQEAVLKV
jgi:hypothetical protein